MGDIDKIYDLPKLTQLMKGRTKISLQMFSFKHNIFKLKKKLCMGNICSAEEVCSDRDQTQGLIQDFLVAFFFFFFF